MNLLKDWKNRIYGMSVTFLLAIIATILGNFFPIIGGPIFGILLGMLAIILLKKQEKLAPGINFTSKKILQYAVILLGFGLNLKIVWQTGVECLPIILTTISISLITAFIICKSMHLPSKTSMLIGVGSSICGGSAIAATAPVIDAKDSEVAQSISVIFFFNLMAALLFPQFGEFLGFSSINGNAFGIFAGSAVNDTSSVVATASTWDAMHNLGTETLDKAVTVKLTRTLAIIPIVLGIFYYQLKNNLQTNSAQKVDIKKSLPTFIIYFVIASFITTIVTSLGMSEEIFTPIKKISTFFIVWSMVAIGFNTNIVHLIKTGSKAIFLGLCCWIMIIITSLGIQHLLAIW